jgi:hypothetical protein
MEIAPGKPITTEAKLSSNADGSKLSMLIKYVYLSV